MKRRLPLALLAVVVLATGGFAAASIASGARLLAVLTGTTATTATTSTTSTTSSGRKVTVCHLTGSKKHPGVTITVSQKAVASVLKGGGHLGPCTGTETRRTNTKGSDGHHGTTTTTSTTTSSDGSTHGNGHGSGGSHGHGHGNGK